MYLYVVNGSQLGNMVNSPAEQVHIIVVEWSCNLVQSLYRVEI